MEGSEQKTNLNNKQWKTFRIGHPLYLLSSKGRAFCGLKGLWIRRQRLWCQPGAQVLRWESSAIVEDPRCLRMTNEEISLRAACKATLATCTSAGCPVYFCAATACSSAKANASRADEGVRPSIKQTSHLCSKSTGAVTSCTRKYLASAGYFRATASYIA